MKRLIVCKILIILLASNLFASPCTTGWRPPKLYGVRLGMTVRQVKMRFPNLKISPPNKYKVRDSFVYLTGSNSHKKYKVPRSVFSIEMLFLKARLVRYQIKFYDSENWKNMDEFASVMSEALNLAELDSLETRFPQGYSCKNIEVSFWEDSSKSIKFFDLTAKPILDEMIEESYKNATLRD